MRVLFTNNTLATRAGSELWVRDMALALLRRGHTPLAYSRELGDVATELRAATVPVVDDLEKIAEPPDVIHAHHHLEAMTACLAFPQVPALFVSHGWLPAEEAPPRFPSIRRYGAVDDLVRERLVSECGIAPASVVTVRNFVDLERFRPRPPLPARPACALLVSHTCRPDELRAVHEACAASGLTLDVIGLAGGNVARPEGVLPGYDVVFAKGRAALEAAAVGCFVVLADRPGIGPALTPDAYDHARALNFGVRLLQEPFAVAALVERIARYDAAQSAAVRDRVRAEAGLDAAAERLLAVYAEVIDEWRALPAPEAWSSLRAASRYLRFGPLRGGDLGAAERERHAAERAVLLDQRDRLAAERDRLAAQVTRLAHERDGHTAQITSLAHERDVLAAQREHLVRDLRAITASAAWRLRQRLLDSRMLTAVYRRLRRLPP